MAMSVMSLAEKKNLVSDLVKECPNSHNLINFSCPIRNVRKLNTENLTHYIEGLSEGQIDHILNYHIECYGLDTVPCSEKRQAKRVPAPGGSEAILKGRNNIASDYVRIKDISLLGMLICAHDKRERFLTNSSIDEICISIPVAEAVSGAKSFLFMGKGKIVHSFTDEISQTLCYGVEFINDSLYLKERLMTVIEAISPVSQ